MLLIAAEASELSEEVYGVLQTWSSLGLLEPFIFNDANETDSGIRCRLVQSGDVREEPLERLLANFLGDLTIFWLTVSVVEPETIGLAGSVAAQRVLEETSQMVANLKKLTRLRIFASDRPGTRFAHFEDEGWPFRAFLVPEDRARSDALSNLVPERFAAHVAAGIASIGNLWPSPPPDSGMDVTKWIVEDQHGNDPGAVWLVRQFAKVVELPTLFGELLGGAALDELAYPNPSQEEFERVDLADRALPFAKTFVNHFEELQPMLPKLVHEDPPRKTSLLHALEEIFAYMVSRLTMRPVELLDQSLGKLYNSAAAIVEHAFPGQEISVERWSEIGSDSKKASEVVSDLVRASEVLVEGSLGKVWEEYWKLCTGLIDGSPTADILGEQLFLTTKNRRQIAKVPRDVVLDPLGLSVIPTTAENGASANQAAPTAASETTIEDAPDVKTDFNAAIEEPKELSGPNTSSGGTVATEPVHDPSFTGEVRSEIDRLRNGELKQQAEIEKLRAEAVAATDNEPEKPSVKRSWLSRLFHRSKPKIENSPDKVNRRTTKRIRRTFLLGSLLAIAGMVFLILKHHSLWAIVWLVGVLLFSCVKALLHAFVGGRREKAAVEEVRSRQNAVINGIITEATLRINIQNLDRRLREVEEWNRIIGMVVHHPWRFGQSENVRLARDTWPLPLSVERAIGVLEGTRIKALQHEFNGFLFQKGWLGARFKELEGRALHEITEISGNAGAGTLQMIEGDTSLDPDSPRRVFARFVESTLTADGDDPDLRAKVNEFLKDDRPLGHLISEVKGVDPDVQSETGVSQPIGEYFANLRLAGGVFLSAHWLDATSEGASNVNASVVLGDGENASVVVRVASQAGSVMPARMVSVNVQKSERMGIENLRAFQLTGDVPGVKSFEDSPEVGAATNSPAVEDNPPTPQPSLEVTDVVPTVAGSQAGVDIVPEEVLPTPNPMLSEEIQSVGESGIAHKEDPPDLRGEGLKFAVGHPINPVSKEEIFFWPGNTALSQLNVGVAGDLGTGKTQLLKMMIVQLRRSSRQSQGRELPILIFDYKCDFQDSDFINDVGGRVILPHQIPLNVLLLSDNNSQQSRVERARAFIDIIGKIFKSIGPKQRNRLLTVIVGLYESLGAAPTLNDVLSGYIDGLDDDDGVVSVLNAFALYEIFSTDRENNVTFDDLLGDDVLVVDLSSLKTDQDMKNAIVALFLNEYYEYMISQTKWPYVGEAPQLRCVNSYLLVDEAINILQYGFQALESLLLQGREFGVGVILSCQFLSHFDDPNTDYSQTMRTWFVHRVPEISARDLESLGIAEASESQVQMIKGLKNHEMYYVSYGYDGVFAAGIPYYKLPTI